ncbi:hypothetical protein ACHAXT_005706 [Thalassiosira profunda]
MAAALRRAGCILAYDQACVDEACHADLRLAEGPDAHAFSCGGAIAVAWFDVLLNYGLVVLNAAMAVILSRALWERGASGDYAAPSAVAAGFCFSFVRCVGVSIVWCATLGWMLMTRRRCNKWASLAGRSGLVSAKRCMGGIVQSSWLMLLLGIDAIALAYYAVVAEAITTVAHGCAVILGAALWRIACKASC